MIKRIERKPVPQSMGFDVVRRYPHDFDRHLLKFIERARPSTMTSPERLYSLCKAVEYITKNRIPGDIVECGVWRGGSMVAAALTLVALNETTRSLWLYDTFEGMTPPSDKDVRIIGGELADKLLAESSKDKRRSRKSVWCYAPLEEVQKNMADTAYPGPIHYIKGPVEKTIPETAPHLIAILRLDTDWYESTRHELVHLFPRLVPGGVLIIDDYGDWEGSRKAVDEYLEENGLPIFLSRIDSARLAIVPGYKLATAPHKSSYAPATDRLADNALLGNGGPH